MTMSEVDKSDGLIFVVLSIDGFCRQQSRKIFQTVLRVALHSKYPNSALDYFVESAGRRAMPIAVVQSYGKVVSQKGRHAFSVDLTSIYFIPVFYVYAIFFVRALVRF